MAQELATKKTFGGCDLDHIRPMPEQGLPKALNVVVSFEDALKLHLSLGEALARLNSYNRSTKAGKRSAVNLCLYTQANRITVNEDKLRSGPPGHRSDEPARA